MGTAFAKPVQYTLKDIANISLHLDVLFHVKRHLFEFHNFVASIT
jgi:hypothetical protein